MTETNEAEGWFPAYLGWRAAAFTTDHLKINDAFRAGYMASATRAAAVVDAPPAAALATPDRAKVIALIDYMVGGRVIAVNSETGGEFTAPYSPELRAFIVAHLGEETPVDGWWVITQQANKARALARFMRTYAEAIERECER